MSDKKSKKSIDLEANLAKIANAKPRRRSRKNDIYERFITRVENVDSNDNEDGGAQANGISGNGRLAPLKNADKLSSYEPLSAAELELFASQQEDFQQESSLQRTSSKSTGVHLNFFDEDERLEVSGTASNEADLPHDAMVKEKASFSSTDSLDDAKHISESSDESIDNDHLVVQNPTAFILSKNKKLASSKKPLIIGMIVGSLLIAAVVLALIFTGILSTSTTAPAPVSKVVASDNAGTSNGSNNSESNTINTANNSAYSSNQSTVDTQPNIANTDVKGANNKQAAAINVSEDESTPEPVITYEDFRQESQSTLYRETND
ncbi:hypothetical protein [Psychrobacter sp. M9-54-1]|uniref:hypothetical protein n=1 Tax=Psychrobacter sp. M9-54-1 TaxID=2782386 RepID=UPI001909CC9C|nr:hypothetical protein [Psychrobacter sp. M9-54-1]MBK3393193.1 hypothetical protein [Psychrobacter sp. M9-54-1]